MYGRSGDQPTCVYTLKIVLFTRNNSQGYLCEKFTFETVSYLLAQNVLTISVVYTEKFLKMFIKGCKLLSALGSNNNVHIK